MQNVICFNDVHLFQCILHVYTISTDVPRIYWHTLYMYQFHEQTGLQTFIIPILAAESPARLFSSILGLKYFVVSPPPTYHICE